MAERYDTLPQWVAFVHGAPHGTRHTLHRVAACLWREAPPEWNAAETVPDYVPIVPTTYVAHRDIHYRDWEPGYAELWRRWRSSFRPASAALARDAIDDPTPHLPRQHTGVRNVSFECCAQFLASRRALRRNPRQVYEVGLEVALTFDGANPIKASVLDKASNFGLNWAGSAFEHIWHVLLGQPVHIEKHCNPCASEDSGQRGMGNPNASHGPFRCCATTTGSCPADHAASERPRARHARCDGAAETRDGRQHATACTHDHVGPLVR